MKNFTKLLLVVLICSSTLYADVFPHVLRKYKRNDLFVCMGIHSCESPANALNIGYKTLHLIDSNVILVNHAKIIFPKDLTVNVNKVSKDYHIHHGEIEAFEHIIADIDVPMTIFLSNHYFGAGKITENNVLDELDLIKGHPIKDHVIMIDYIHHQGTPEFGNISIATIQDKIREINPLYQFVLEQGGHLGKEAYALLVAYIP